MSRVSGFVYRHRAGRVALLILLAAIFLMAEAAGAAKQASAEAVNVGFRIGDHKGFSRLVFDWPAATTAYESRIDGDTLEITFDAVARINLAPLNNDPLAFAHAARLESAGDKTRVLISLASGSMATDFRNKNSVVFDIRKGERPADATAATPSAKTETQKAAAADPIDKSDKEEPITSDDKKHTETSAPTTSPPVAEPLATVKATAAASGDAPQTSAHPLAQTQDDETAREAAAAKSAPTSVITTHSIASPAPAAHGFEWAPSGPGSAIAPIAPTIVLDKAPEKNTAPRTEAATDAASAVPAVSAPALLIPAETTSAPIVTLAPVEVATPKAETREAVPVVQLRITNQNDGFRLSFPWDEPAAMAMFRAGDAYWVVFDRPAKIDLGNLAGPYELLVLSARQLDIPGATLLRFTFRDGYAPKVTRTGNEWTADFTVDDAPRVTHSLGVQTDGISGSKFRAFIPVVSNAHEVRFTEPASGEEIIALPLGGAGQGIQDARYFNGITILPTVQGVALQAGAADVRIGQETNGIAVTAVSPEFAATDGPRKIAKLPGSEIYPTPVIRKARVVRFDEWRQVSAPLFTLRRQELQQAAAQAPKQQKRQAMGDLARFFVGHKYYAEALGVLAELKRRYPAIEKDREFRLLAGLSELGMRHFEAASSLLFDADFNGDVEVAPFRGMIAAGEGDWERALQELNYAAPAFAALGREWADHFHLLQARAALQNVDVNLARQALDQVKAPTLSAQRAEKAYLEGVHAMQLSDYPTATEKFDAAISLGHRPITEEARFQKVNVALMAKQISPAEAIAALEKLDFAWRGDAVEVERQKRLGDLYVATGEVDKGLDAYKRIVRHYPDSPYSRDLGRRMNDLFAELFLEGGADELPPIKALAIYYQYRELTPVGARGDRMIQILADRLTRVDLLEQAAQLLEHQVNFRLEGAEKARIGTRLAIVQLWNNKPDAALRALYDTRWRALPEADKRERLYLEAQAQAELANYTEALTLIALDNSIEADKLRAEIYWKSHNWAEAIPAIEKLIGRRGSETVEDAARLDRQRVMQLAVALNLADDKAGLRRLRERYNGKMAGSPDQAAFDLITEQNNPNEADFRERATLIAQVGQLENFMAGYRAKLKNGELWASY